MECPQKSAPFTYTSCINTEQKPFRYGLVVILIFCFSWKL